ncbi:MAG: ATP synthase F1 subunit delta [Mycoplasmataceae bacterium]|nr:ATP synthase F1 subunit delta [Mycoplasmataceae bacterium]
MYKDENSIGYSLALFSIAKDENKIEEYLDQAKTLSLIFLNEDNYDFIKILNASSIEASEKDKIISSTFNELSVNFLNFLKLLASKNKFKSINKILSIFIRYCYETLKIKEGIVYSSSLLSKQTIEKLENKISEEKKYEVNLKNLLDKELISGIKIVIGNSIIENSVISELEEIRKALRGTK